MTEAGGRLRQVVEHWMPRIQTAGITALDAERLIAEAGDWPNWCATWVNEGERQLELGAEAAALGRSLTAGEAYQRAALAFHFGQFMFFDDLAQKERAAARRVEAYRRAAPNLVPPAEAVAISFRGAALHGYLRRPAGTKAPFVAIVPGSDSTKEEFGTLEEHFLKRGLATLSVDGPGQGEGRSFGPLDPRDWPEALAAIAAAAKPEFGGRLGVMGMAFGGHLALQGAHAVPEIAAVVCMNGFYDLGSFWDALPEIYRANMRYTLGGASLEDTRERARRFSLAGVPAPRCPVLVVHGGRDRIFPPADARRIAGFAGTQAQMVEYPDGNHVCNNLAYRYRPLIADWLAERLGGRVQP